MEQPNSTEPNSNEPRTCYRCGIQDRPFTVLHLKSASEAEEGFVRCVPMLTVGDTILCIRCCFELMAESEKKENN